MTHNQDNWENVELRKLKADVQELQTILSGNIGEKKRKKEELMAEIEDDLKNITEHPFSLVVNRPKCIVIEPPEALGTMQRLYDDLKVLYARPNDMPLKWRELRSA